MSDVALGSGWWQASDGRWYPPERHPNFNASSVHTAVPEAASVDEAPMEADRSSQDDPVELRSTSSLVCPHGHAVQASDVFCSTCGSALQPSATSSVEVPPEGQPSTATSDSSPASPTASTHPPGWWVASDGNWYPPEQHPAPSPPAVSKHRPQYSPYQTFFFKLGLVVVALLIVILAAYLLQGNTDAGALYNQGYKAGEQMYNDPGGLGTNECSVLFAPQSVQSDANSDSWVQGCNAGYRAAEQRFNNSLR
jgi:hypothetical protein